MKVSNKFTNEQLIKVLESVLEAVSLYGTYEQTF